MNLCEMVGEECKIRLGGANFDSYYGMLPNRALNLLEAQKIIDRGTSVGINRIDSALNYVNANRVLGGLDLSQYPRVGTKISIKDSILPLDDLCRLLSFHLENFHLNSFEYVLIHDGDDLKNQSDHIRRTVEYNLRSLREIGLTEQIGISLYDYEILHGLNDLIGEISLIQGPFNIFDQRCLDSEIREKLMTYKYQARSVFLQGLLLVCEEIQCAKFPEFRQMFQALNEFCVRHDVSRLEFCLGLLKKTQFVNEVVLGVNSEAQLRDLVLAQQSMVIAPIVELDYGDFRVDDRSLIYPPAWVN